MTLKLSSSSGRTEKFTELAKHFMSLAAARLSLLSFINTGHLRVVTDSSAVVGALNNVVASGGYNTSYDQYGQMMVGASYIRSRINAS